MNTFETKDPVTIKASTEIIIFHPKHSNCTFGVVLKNYLRTFSQMPIKQCSLYIHSQISNNKLHLGVDNLETIDFLWLEGKKKGTEKK